MLTLTRTLLPAPNGPLDGLEAAPPDGGEYYCSAVLVPGHEPKEVFVPLMRLLIRDGLRVLTLDHRPEQEPAELVRDLEVALTAAAARHPVHLVGHGFGVVLAARIAMSAPENCRSFTAIAAPDGDLVSAVSASGIPTLVVEEISEAPETVADRVLVLWRTCQPTSR